jgi:hypothetical protein
MRSVCKPTPSLIQLLHNNAGESESRPPARAQVIEQLQRLVLLNREARSVLRVGLSTWLAVCTSAPLSTSKLSKCRTRDIGGRARQH